MKRKKGKKTTIGELTNEIFETALSAPVIGDNEVHVCFGKIHVS